MQAYRIRYRNSQGTLIRILGSVVRRGLELHQVEATPGAGDGLHTLELRFHASARQQAQLGREWRGTIDVAEVSLPCEAPGGADYATQDRTAPRPGPARLAAPAPERLVPRHAAHAGK